MNTLAADDYAAIKARMEEIAKERETTHEYAPAEPKAIEHDMLTLDWAIYAPVCLAKA